MFFYINYSSANFCFLSAIRPTYRIRKIALSSREQSRNSESWHKRLLSWRKRARERAPTLLNIAQIWLRLADEREAALRATSAPETSKLKKVSSVC
jgi:hypothetical protein